MADDSATGDTRDFVFGVDLDGVVADFYKFMRTFAASWTGQRADDLPTDVKFGLREWGISDAEYPRMHRNAVAEHNMYERLDTIGGAPQGLRYLSNRGVRIRIVTHRLYVAQLHRQAVSQTVQWLDRHGVPYSDLCFMGDKGEVGADVYVDDSPRNITDLRAIGADVIIFRNSTNADIESDSRHEASSWDELVKLVLDRRDGESESSAA